MKKTILIIEDQAPMRRNIALMLEMEGHETLTAENGKIGLKLALEKRPDLILCDVMMPEMDGYGVVQALREEKSMAAVPFIFLTAKSDSMDHRIGMNFGADDYLTKPIIRDDLLAAVQARLSRAEAMTELIQQAATQNGNGGFNPDFSSPAPLQKAFGLTPREAEVLLWVAQGKSNADVASILGMAEATTKHHMGVIFGKLGVESRNGATLSALEVLSGP